jgi:hypothetical protein
MVDSSSDLYNSAVTRYISLGSMEGLGGFITMNQVVTAGVFDAGEVQEQLSDDPFFVVTGPPVVPSSVFSSAEIGIEGDGTAWPSARVYPLVLPTQRGTRSCRPQDLPDFLKDSFNSFLVSLEPFKMLGPVLIGDREGRRKTLLPKPHCTGTLTSTSLVLRNVCQKPKGLRST